MGTQLAPIRAVAPQVVNSTFGISLSQPTAISPAPSLAGPSKRILGSTTARVVTALLFVLGLVFFFQYTPNGLRWPLRVLWLASIIWLVVVTVRTVRTTRFTRRKIAFILIIGGFYYVVLLLICHVFIKEMSQRDDRLTTRGMTSLAPDCKSGIQAMLDDNQFNKFSAAMGWVPKPGRRRPGYNVSAQSVRGRRVYPQQPVNPEQRILCMGDSYTFGVAARDDETYPAQAEKLKPGTEWINFGIPGGCLVQSYQRYMHEARHYGGRRVVIGFMTNDAQRTVNVFRPFLIADSGAPLTKPFAKYVEGKFSIEPNPCTSTADLVRLLGHESDELKKLLQLDYLTWGGRGGKSGPISRTAGYVWEVMRLENNVDTLLDHRLPLGQFVTSILPLDPYGRDIWNPASPGFKAICAMFDRFHAQVVSDGREPLFVIIPGPLDVDDYRRDLPRQYAALVDHLEAKNFAFLDFLDPLVSKHRSDLSEDALFVRLHYRGHINKELAEAIIKALELPAGPEKN